MVLSLKNIGKLATVQVAIEGITVIAGENDTGKSTVGKALFAVFNSFYNLDEQVRSEQIIGVERQVSLLYDKRIRNRLAHGVDITEAARDIVAQRELHCKDLHSIEKRTLEPILRDEHSESGNDPDMAESIDLRSGEIARQIQEILNIPDEEIRKAIVERKLNSEFNDQVTNFNSNQKGEFRLEIEDKDIVVSVEDNNVADIKGSINLSTEAVYIDDPLILDAFAPSYFRYQPDSSDHRGHLRKKLFYDNKDAYAVEKIIRTKKFENIYRKISSACGGEMVEKKQGGYGYKSAESDKLLDLRNLSTGLKTFVILKMLLMKGGIQQNGVVILDEPEIHLHPEWQLLFAELIVMLHKEFGVHILLNTHSPYFLRAIQVYSAKYEMADKCRYYLSENSGSLATITDVSDDIERIYAKLSKPLQDLEDERWRDDSMA